VKKLLAIIVLGLLFSGNANANHLKIKLKDENQIVLQEKFNNRHEWPMSEAHCGQYKKFNWRVGSVEEHGSKWILWICSAEKIYTYKGSHLNKHQDADKRYNSNHPWVTATKNKTSTNDKITQSKQICKDLGFKPNNEKFADCALKMMSLQFEASNKQVATGGGTQQQIIIKEQQDYNIFDAMIDLSLLNTAINSAPTSNNTNCRVVKKHWGADLICR
tara:strand:- start:59 stop:712 length:654 start_codon:yes stop_codon:yes gene_type:complete